jgi:hypothetical protein
MELFAEAISVVGALLLSISCGLLLEELIFGGLVRLFFAPKPATQCTTERTATNAPQPEGERPCLR